MAREAATLLAAAQQQRTPRLGPIMALLDNSPVLAAYGMVRSGCCEQSGASLIGSSSGQQGGGNSRGGGEQANAPLSPFQLQAQQHLVQLMSALGAAPVACAADGMPPRAPLLLPSFASARAALGQPLSPAAGARRGLDASSMARALEMLYTGDAAGLEAPASIGASGRMAPCRALTAASRVRASGGPMPGSAGGARLPPALSAPCTSQGGLCPTGSLRALAGRNLPLLSARASSRGGSVRGSQAGLAPGDGGGAWSEVLAAQTSFGGMRWGDVAAMRGQVRRCQPEGTGVCDKLHAAASGGVPGVDGLKPACSCLWSGSCVPCTWSAPLPSTSNGASAVPVVTTDQPTRHCCAPALHRLTTARRGSCCSQLTGGRTSLATQPPRWNGTCG